MGTLSLAISHTPWKRERVESMRRLREQLGIELGVESCEARVHLAHYTEITSRARNHEWSAEMWRWAAETGADHCVFLQDDVVVPTNFFRALRAMLELVPDQVIGLETVHRAARALHSMGERFCTTSDGLIGVGYVMPRELLVEFLAWRSSALKDGALEQITEDTLIGLWCLATGRRIWHPIPTIIDHDTSLPSTYGNDDHANRRPSVAWHALVDDELELEVYEAGDDENPPHLGRFYETSPATAREWVRDFDQSKYNAAVRDNGAAELRRITYAMRSRRAAKAPVARVMVCTPTRGGTSPAYNSAIWRLAVAQDIEVVTPFELENVQQHHQDVVRVRSRMVRTFLESDATHLFFVDADISFEPKVLAGMLATGRDFVAAPYPRRDRINFAAVAAPDERPPEARAYHYPVRLDDRTPGTVHPDGCTDVSGIGLGCALLSRGMLERMVAHYRAELEFDDDASGAKIPTVAIFQLMLRDRALLSEDLSFCQRWRDIGGTIGMYLGPGSPVTHHGEHTYRGYVEAFGLKRVDAAPPAGANVR